MIYINPNYPEVKKALDEHYGSVKCFLLKKLGEKCLDKNCKICNSKIQKVSGIKKALKTCILENLEDIICGMPSKLLDINRKAMLKIFEEDFYNKINSIIYIDRRVWNEDEKENIKIFKKKILRISKIFNYSGWFAENNPDSQYSAYHLAKNLNRRTCTYCNRTYTTTMVSCNGGKLMRPQFDHWFPQKYFPLLALSFYNLIPCCSICNSSSKGETVLNINEHIHPYIDINQTNDFSFKYSFDKNLNEYNIYIESNNGENKSKATLEKLEVVAMYNAHKTELKDLIKIKQEYSDRYIEKIADFFQSGLSKKETFRLLFGTELDQKDFHSRPMSKFKFDILKELGII